jgi:hypothetical protein
LVYGDIAKYVKERSQLHKIVEKHLWMFGENYNGTPKLFSDKNLANNLVQLRNDLFNYELTEADENLFPISDEKVRNITDLFFYNERITDNQKREIMVVELKAPKVKLSDKELTQARRYAMQIEKGGVFPKNHSYKVLLVGSEISDSAKAQCGQPGSQNPHIFYKSKEQNVNVEVWAIHWSDLIEQNRTKLSYLGTALNTKDRDVRDVFEQEFKEIDLQRLDSILEPNRPTFGKKRKK